MLLKPTTFSKISRALDCKGVRGVATGGGAVCAADCAAAFNVATSVMIDASHEPFEKNVEITRKVVEYAHKHNCVVESELGHLVGAQFDDGEEGGGGAATCGAGADRSQPQIRDPLRRSDSEASDAGSGDSGDDGDGGDDALAWLDALLAGEGIRDLRPFNSFEFVEALLAK